MQLLNLNPFTMNQPLLVIGLTLAVCASQAQTLEQASVKRGMILYDSRCFGCHSVDANRVGPMHVGILGRKAGGVSDFIYSKALKKSNIVWSQSTLNDWLKNPQGLIPGQSMNVNVPNEKDREDLVAYLASLTK
jgi:cytochrome c